uniref:G-protein coupled receptors family 1 profile domain-containing protein n=1 Tax=Plectus sambesii TaxID=2011161 RepID=A0A914VKK0_9BILA
MLKFPFYKLMFSLGVADTLQILNLLLGNTLAGLGWIWSDRFTHRLIFLQWFISIIIVLPMIYPVEFQISVDKDNRTVYLQWKYSTDASAYNYAVGVFGSAPLAITVFAIYTIIFTTTFVRKIRSGQPMGKAEKIALKMALTGFACFIGWFIALCNSYSRLVAWTFFKVLLTEVSTYWMWTNVGNSIFAAVNPYAMLIFSSAFRARFKQQYFGCCLKSGGSGGTRTDPKTAPRTITVQPTSQAVLIEDQ